MKPSDRIMEIATEGSRLCHPTMRLALTLEAVIAYLDEEYERKQKSIELTTTEEP